MALSSTRGQKSHRLDTIMQVLNFSRLHWCKPSLVCHQVAWVCENQTWRNLIFIQTAASSWMKIKFLKINLHQVCMLTCNLQQNCYHQAGASDGNASWYRLDDCKGTSLQQTCCNLCVSDSVFLCVHDIVVCTWTLTKSMFSFPKHKRKRRVELSLLRKYDIIYQKSWT